MLDNIQEAVFNYTEYQQQGAYGVTSLEKSRYRFWVEKNNPGVDCTLTTGKIDSVIGTAFHEFAEKAVNASDVEAETEVRLEGDICGYSVGGTADLLIDSSDGIIIGDWKTMKAFPAKKALNGDETEKFIKQLSVYAYLLRKQGKKTAPTGYIYVVVVGWTARDKAIPRTFRLDLPLMTDTEVEEYVKGRIEPTLTDEEPEVDCPNWMCEQYCGVREVCPHYNNKGFKNEE